jgi:hypothetical protein
VTDPDLRELLVTGLRGSAYRWEALPAYEVPNDKGALGSDYDRYLAGEPEPDWGRKQPWLDTLAAGAARGIRRSRVRLLHDPLTDYERYECEWGYALNGPAGEDVYVIDPAEQARPELVVDHDFWLIDDEHCFRMDYTPAGEIQAAVYAPELLGTCRRARDAALSVAVEFAGWWQRHPEHHRQARASA